MANLNFQQPPRSIANSGLGGTGRVASATGYSSAGHVTPTFGSSSSDKIGNLSPGRSNGTSSAAATAAAAAAQSLNSRNSLFGQRNFNNESRRVQSSSNAMSSVSALSRYANYHSVFGGDGDSSTPPLLDLSEFPSLTGARSGGSSVGGGSGTSGGSAGGGDHAPPSAAPQQPPGVKPYVGMVKAPTAEASEFQMSSEDFPALPGTNAVTGQITTATGGTATPTSNLVQSLSNSSCSNGSSNNSNSGSAIATNNNNEMNNKKNNGVQTSIQGTVTNIPASMVPNQFGIVGLLTFIRAAESDPTLVSLALGQDLTALGLNLNSSENLYLTFAGPWADMPCRPQDIDYPVPPEYLINSSIRDKLAPLRLSRYKEDLLFYLFYCFVGDVLQIAAATELYNREWRYHTEEKVWISQAPGMPMLEKTNTYERGTYYFFDAHNWRKVAKEFHLDYAKLEGRPQLPAH